MNRLGRTCRDYFSLLEVVIVVVTIAILATVSIPRMSRGSRGDCDSSVGGSLAMLRNAVDRYSSEHAGAFPTATNINDQLTRYTDVLGSISDTKTATHIYGPYLRSIPSLPVGAPKGRSRIAGDDASDVGWLYTEASGTIKANTATEKDNAGKLYSDY